MWLNLNDNDKSHHCGLEDRPWTINSPGSVVRTVDGATYTPDSDFFQVL